MKSNAESNQWTVSNFNFKTNTAYYWRVDDNAITSNIYDGSGNVIGSNTTLYKGQIWKFTTHDGRAYNPSPYNGRVGLTEPLALSWTPGNFTLNQMVFVGTDSGTIYSATSSTAKAYRAPVLPRTTSSYSLTGLGTGWYRPLSQGTTYWWKVTEVNGTTQWGSTGLSGVTAPILWTFTPAAYINIDDFEDYNSTADMNWLNGSVLCTDPILGTYTVYPTGTMTLALDALGKHGALYYNPQPYTEVSRTYSGGSIFTGNTSVLSPQPKAIRVDYIGASTNATDPTYNVMYVALEDTAGHVGVYLGDPAAQLATAWTQWYIPLTDPNFSGVNEGAISAFHLGFGGAGRCLPSSPLGPGNDGNVMFDNIRLYAATCNPAFAPEADLDGDCDVDINDLLIFSNDWLKKATVNTFPTITAPGTPILWYKFNETSGTAVTDYGTNGYTGTVVNLATQGWDATDGRKGHNGCLYLPSGGNSYVSCSTSALSFMSDANHSAPDGGGITFATWINADLTNPAFINGWVYGFIVVKDVNGNDAVEIACPHHHNNSDWSANNAWAGWAKIAPNDGFSLGPSTSAENYGGRWNHWAFVKAPHAVSWYCNGYLLRQEADTDANAGDPNITDRCSHCRQVHSLSALQVGLGTGQAESPTSRFMTTHWVTMK